MNMDTLSLIVKSSVDKVKNSVKTMINTFQQYSNVLDKTKQSMQGVANATNNTDSNLNKSKQNIDDLTKKLEKMKNAYRLNQKAFSQRPSGTDYAQPFYKGSDWITDTTSSKFITQKSLNEEKAKINELEKELKELRGESDKPIQPKIMVPKTPAQDLKNTTKETKNTRDELDKLKNSFSKLVNATKGIGKIFNRFSKGMDGNFNRLKKIALGLIGVRTAMSVLTKSVNAYLSFDSELQDSLTNLWNMLGSLLAPAIEFVARMFAIATNYVVQFVNALTGIDLVARANAKALQTQAKATKGVGESQRGLLGMDEITNLPTEPGGAGGSSAPQIKMDDSIKSFKALDDILQHLKDGQWHLVGEDIAKGINGLLSNIRWKEIQNNFQKIGYNIADFLNGLFEVDWTLLGTTLGNGINTAINFAYGFVEKFSFIQFGSGLGRAISNAFTSIDWEMLSTTLSDGIVGIFNGISAFLFNVDWDTIGENIKMFLVNIKWGEIAEAVLDAMRNAFSGIDELLEGIFGESTTNIIEGIAIAIGAVASAVALTNAYLALTDVLANPITLIVIGIGLATAGIIALAKNFDKISATASKVFNVIGKLAKIMASIIINSFIWQINGLIDGLNLFLIPLRGIIVLIGQAMGKNLTMNNVRIPTIKPVALATGTPNIETEGLYHLHEGEMVVPKRYNPNTDGYNSGSDNREIIDLLVSLNASMLEYAERPININMNSRKVAEATYDDMQQIDRNRNKSTAVVRS